VLVDDAMSVVYVHGNVGAFLERPEGASAANLLKLGHGDTAAAVRSAILKRRPRTARSFGTCAARPDSRST